MRSLAGSGTATVIRMHACDMLVCHAPQGGLQSAAARSLPGQQAQSVATSAPSLPAADVQSVHLPKTAPPQPLDLTDLRWRPRPAAADATPSGEAHAAEHSIVQRERRSMKRGSREPGIQSRDVVDLTHALREHSSALRESTRAMQEALQEVRHGRRS